MLNRKTSFSQPQTHSDIDIGNWIKQVIKQELF